VYTFYALPEGLVEVFNPRAKPWVKMNGAGTGRIIEQVRKCPSGALSYFLNAEQEVKDEKVVSETADMLKVEVTINGPYVIKSEWLIVYGDGRRETKSGMVALCRCGSSEKKPYCDGSHAKIQFRG
jgi:Iron-binding zinc finger CDGSH type/Divergent 4Fe-4S mono-cluster